MELLISLLLFTGDLPHVLSLTRKYFLIQEPKSWDDAHAYCRAAYTDLAVITNSTELIDIQSIAWTQALSSSAWVGLYTDVHGWYWSINNEPLGSFTAWGLLEPNNVFGNEMCGAMFSGLWLDALCSMTLPFVCFDDRPTATELYVFIQQPMSWSDAQSYCRQHHTDLASARDAAENLAVANKEYFSLNWFGLRRDPLKWIDQTTDVSFLTLGDANADDYQYNKNCGYLNGGQADQGQCSVTMPFFCYSYQIQRKTIRLKIQSSQDVNDPAIISDIEGKLKEKLRKHGMAENITVTWRKQPNGDVFHKEENVTAL